jgi:hypothetical protein
MIMKLKNQRPGPMGAIEPVKEMYQLKSIQSVDDKRVGMNL